MRIQTTPSAILRLRSSLVLSALALAVVGCGDDVVSTTSASASEGSSSSSSSSSSTTTSSTSATETMSSSGSASMSATGTTTTEGTTTSSETSTTTGSLTTTEGTSTTTTTTGTTTEGTTTEGTTTEGTTTTTTEGTTTTTTTEGTTTGGDELDAAYVGMSLTDSLVAFDLMTEEVIVDVDLLPEADYPYDVTIRPGGEEVWIVGAVGDGVKVVDTATNTVTQSIDLSGVGEYAVDVLFSSDGALAYVSARDSEALVIIDADTYMVQGSIPLPGAVDGGKMTLDPCTDLVYMVDWYDSNLLKIDVAGEKIDVEPLGKSLWDLRITADGKTLYVTDRGTDEVHIVDAATMQATGVISVGDDPWGIELAENDSVLVVACEDDSTVHLIDTGDLSSIVKTLPMGAKPRDVDVLGNAAYVPSGDVLGNDGVYKLVFDADEAVFIDLGENYNSNAIAVRPQPVTCKG